MKGLCTCNYLINNRKCAGSELENPEKVPKIGKNSLSSSHPKMQPKTFVAEAPVIIRIPGFGAKSVEKAFRRGEATEKSVNKKRHPRTEQGGGGALAIHSCPPLMGGRG
jgi:hypothetical protein